MSLARQTRRRSRHPAQSEATCRVDNFIDTNPAKMISLSSIHKWLFSPISLLGGNFNPRNINHMPAVKISARLELDENISFMDGH